MKKGLQKEKIYKKATAEKSSVVVASWRTRDIQ